MELSDKGAVMKRPRRNHTAAYKAKVALAALKGDKTLAELSEKFDVHASQIVQWKTQLLDGAVGVFLSPAEKRESQGPSVKDMQAKIGQLALENYFSYGPRCQAKQGLFSPCCDEGVAAKCRIRNAARGR